MKKTILVIALAIVAMAATGQDPIYFNNAESNSFFFHSSGKKCLRLTMQAEKPALRKYPEWSAKVVLMSDEIGPFIDELTRLVSPQEAPEILTYDNPYGWSLHRYKAVLLLIDEEEKGGMITHDNAKLLLQWIKENK